MMKKLNGLRREGDLKEAEAPSMPFDELIQQVLAVSEGKFNLNAVLSDPVSGKMTEQFRAELIREGLVCGESYATDCLAKESDIYQLLKTEKLEFTVETMPAGGGHVIFAQYVEPNKITLFTDSLDQYEALVKKTAYQNKLGRQSFEELLIAHEFFHYLEFKNAKSIITLNKKLKLWGVFGYEYKTTLISLSEIAAMAFAKKYTGFDYSPFILDILLTYPYNQSMSYKIFQKIANQKVTLIGL